MKSGWSFLVCRFFVGVAEGPFLPMVSSMGSSWYTKGEAPIRMAIWNAGNIASNIFPGLLAAGILENMKGVGGLHSWQWFVLIEGIIGIAVAIVGFWRILNFAHNTRTYLLTPEEGEMAQYRMMVSNGGHSEDNEGEAWEGTIMAIRDPFTWIFPILHFGLILALSFKDFFPSLRSQEPLYRSGDGLIIFGCGMGFVGCMLARWRSIRLNKKLAAEEAINNEPKGWRYVL
ncbi:major facilitator superfamily domain-containing protein [Clohesyomyces aquaticus]|uniref:Major facilitator superfamily domain-containing protein n=1 Tax=Clohesyomyces aquaticus TaxID=1231657 RepID=A0A1Y1YC82_9PLEO|nr:major facilitator superfamily domain-containing protein [Clohesyomyces aquaticus]